MKQLQHKHPEAEVLSSNLVYLQKRKEQIQYLLFHAQNWPVDSGTAESSNKLVIQEWLKRTGMQLVVRVSHKNYGARGTLDLMLDYIEHIIYYLSAENIRDTEGISERIQLHYQL